MKVTTTLNIYEKNGSSEKLPIGDEVVKIESHWNFTDRVVLKYKDLDITLIASELIKAIHNAQNHK